ncbi:hypothetical protein Ddye_004837 [Dipteronia dyeriana]|uniref:DUF1997 family protein n=1 Tax=Dipteronia dyeriana TaxID=168575 RepID=A0AAD9XF58_9ROSI|nr:hypothetical protein Ddye_004837 [Dipteronia dyeriana]
MAMKMMAMKMMASSSVGGQSSGWLPSFASPKFTGGTRKIILGSNAKIANLSASRKERIKLPDYDVSYNISDFLRHPSGVESMLNTSALHSFQFLHDNTYRCTLPKLQLFNFEAAPVIDLRVTPTNQDCIVELLSCKFEGSDIMERQNDHFSAFMSNHMTWNTNDSESFLEANVKLNISLEIYTRPFTFLPTSAVEGPGNIMMQALVDRLVPLLLQQLRQDYDEWVHQKAVDSSLQKKRKLKTSHEFGA